LFGDDFARNVDVVLRKFGRVWRNSRRIYRWEEIRIELSEDLPPVTIQAQVPKPTQTMQT
jgi:hypothetical protein